TDVITPAETQREHTPQAKIASGTLCRPTLRTDKRFLLQMRPARNAVHEMLEPTRKTSATLTTIECSLPISLVVSPSLSFLREISGEVCKYHAVWRQQTRLRARQMAFYLTSRRQALQFPKGKRRWRGL